MAGSAERIVIVGASLAGASAAMALRDGGFSGHIALIGAEHRLPYNRPGLSKGYLRGEERFEDQLVNPAEEYARRNISIHNGTRATRIDAPARRVELDNGERVPYDRLLVTTGGRNRTLRVPGNELAGVFQLRTAEECDRIRAAARAGARAVVIGMGFIGSEVAASLRQMNVEVTAIVRDRAPLAHVLGPEVGEVLAAIHGDHGVTLALEDSVAAIEGLGRVERVRTTKGRLFPSDLVVAGIGIEPNQELLAQAGARVDNGVLVDAHCRTSLPDVFAAGDVANHEHPLFGRVRVEHWNNALHQGEAAARAMLGEAEPYDYVHSFWSDQYEHLIEYVGFAATWDRVVFRGLPEGRKFLAFYLQGGVLRAAMGLDRGGDPEDPKSDSELKTVAGMIRRQARVDPARLADETVGLTRLAAESA